MSAWQAYNAMTATRERHIDFLINLEARYRKYGGPNTEESCTRARLLDEHDQQVIAFPGAMKTLSSTDAQAHAELVAYITRLNEIAVSGPEGDASPAAQ